MQTTPLKYYRCEFKAMGTLCEIQLFSVTKAKARKVANAAIADVQRLERLYSRYKPDSLLSKINRVAVLGGRITVDEETACLLDYAVTCYQQSDGLFDITSGILRRAWKFDQDQLPEQSLIDQMRLCYENKDSIRHKWKNYSNSVVPKFSIENYKNNLINQLNLL